MLNNRTNIAPFALGAFSLLGAAVWAQTPTAPQTAAANAAAPTVDAQTLVGKTAPAFALPDQNDKSVSLADAKGKWVVLAFYPADMTQGCTLQNRSYTAKADQFTPLNAVVYTVSTQDTASKKQFCSKEGLKHTLLSDVGGKTAQQYGVYTGQVARRVTFYIRPDGTIAEVDTKPKVTTAADDSLVTLARLAKAPDAPPTTDVRQFGKNGPPAVTTKNDAYFVGPAAIKVTMGSMIPDFSLTDTTTGKRTAYSTLAAGKQATAIVFVSTQCPVSNAYNERMEQLAQTYEAKGVRFVGINANSDEAPDAIATHAKTNGFTFPVLKDTGNKVADQFNAKVTPEVFLVDKQGVLVYHGPIDDNQDTSKVTKRYLPDAVDALLSGQPIAQKTARVIGCSIKRAQ